MEFGKTQRRYLNFSDEDRSCRGKMAFSDKKMASAAAKSVREKKRATNLKAYKCRHCPFWHIGRSQHVGRSLEERVACPRGCGNEIRQSRLANHLARCEGPKQARLQKGVQGGRQDDETYGPSQSDLELGLG